MKIRPGQADRNEKASSVYRLRQSTKDESMKRGLSASEPFLAVMKGMWPRRPLGWREPLYPWSSSGAKTTWVGGSNVLGLMGQPRNGPLLPLAFRREVSLVHYCLEESLMISRMPPKARLWLNCNEKSKDNWNFQPTRPLFLCQRWQLAGSSSTVFAFYFFITLSNWGEWSKDKISFNRKKLNARLTMHGKGLIYLGTIFRVTKLAFLERKYYN